MCSESYVQHIWQKYRLAAAIAVLKEKPEDCTVDQYIEQLRTKIKTDSRDELDVTICSEEFDIDIESSNDSDMRNNISNMLDHDSTNKRTEQAHTNDVEINLSDTSQNSESILKYYDVKVNSSTNNGLKDVNNKAENSKPCLSTESRTKHLKANTDHTVNSMEIDYRFKHLNNKDAIAVTLDNGIKHIDSDNYCTKQLKKHNQLKSLGNRVEKGTKVATRDIKLNNPDDKIKNISNTKVQNTTNAGSINLLQGFFNTVNNDTHVNNDTVNTQESISLLNDHNTTDHNYFTDKGERILTDIAMKNDNVKKKRKFDFVEDHSVSEFQEEQPYHSISKTKYICTNINDIAKTNSNIGQEMDVTYYESDPKMLHKDYNKFNQHNNLSKKNDAEIPTNKDSNNTNKHTSISKNIDTEITSTIDKDLTQHYAHVSQSQYENIFIERNLIQSKCKNAKEIKIKSLAEPATELLNVTGCNIDDLGTNVNEVNLLTGNHLETNDKPATMKIVSDVNTESNVVNEHLELDSPKAVFLQNNDEGLREPATIVTNNLEKPSKSYLTQHISETTTIESPKVEKIPFKIIEELNKVKTYLNRRHEKLYSNDGSIDSGYKSDSQGRSIKNSLQTVNWLNQSAHSLFYFMMQSSLELKTQQLTEEISKVISQLVDLLHDEEKYLSFLDELLEYIDNLLQEILNGDTSEDDVLIKKNESVNRLLLLNRSVHIQKYTISKLTDVLQSINTHLTNPENIFEIINTSQIENCSYIFHMLEVILKRYMKHKHVRRVHPSSSQNELRKSSIVSIWRKKWYPHIKENDGSQDIVQSKCVLLKCNDVLNKMVVNCMEGYSLLSFAALQCFNLLQN